MSLGVDRKSWIGLWIVKRSWMNLDCLDLELDRDWMNLGLVIQMNP